MTMSLPQAMKLLPLDSKSSCVLEVTLDADNVLSSCEQTLSHTESEASEYE